MKNLFNKFFNKVPRWEFLLLIVLPFVLWVFCFRDFFSGRLWLEEDAISYADHIRIYIEYLSKGIFPLWDPIWNGGAPNHFFLQRIGDVNPLFLVIMLLKWLGVPLTAAYLVFLGMYYFLAMWAFYLIARFLFAERFFAFAAYILLLFSSWGSEIFYNYIIIIFVPIIWFFYFLLCFSREAKRAWFLGMCMCMGLIIATYIPFFFLTILIIFSIFYALFYVCLFPDLLARSFQFFKENKLFTAFCMMFLILTCIPTLIFYHESKSGEFVLPERHAGAETSAAGAAASAVAVGVENIASGDIISHGYFDRIFYDHRHIDMGDIFIPYIFFLILLCASFGPVNKLIFFLLFNILAISLITITTAAGVHHFLYAHVIFFKFIRNIYYFFWLAMLPMGILLGVAAFRSLLANIDAGVNKTGWLIYITVCHAAFIMFLWGQGGVLIGAWTAVLISWGFFLTYFFCAKTIVRPIAYCLFILAVFIQSAQVYGFLGDKLFQMQQHLVHKVSMEQTLKAPEKTEIVDTSETQQHPGLYYTLRWFAVMINNIRPDILGPYRSHPFILYDNVFPYEDSPAGFKAVESSMASNSNIAYISAFETAQGDWEHKPDAPRQANVDPIASGQLVLLSSDPNTMVIKTHLPARRFLVINDNYDSGWHAFINGHKAPLFRANVTFKGLWVPAGNNTIMLRFSDPLTYLGYIMLVVLYWVTFGYLLVLIKKTKSTGTYA